MVGYRNSVAVIIFIVAQLHSEFVQILSEKIIYEFQIFGFPTHYTDVRNLNNEDRQRLLDKAGLVPVV